MSAASPAEIHCALRHANARLTFWLDSMSAASAGSQTPVATPQQISGLLSALMAAGERLRHLPAVQSVELQRELAQYRRNVEHLRDLLPSIQQALLEQRARLEAERRRLRSAAEWVRGSRQTF